MKYTFRQCFNYNCKYLAMRDGVVAVVYNGVLNLKIKGDSKVIIDCYSNKNFFFYLVQFCY